MFLFCFVAYSFRQQNKNYSKSGESKIQRFFPILLFIVYVFYNTISTDATGQLFSHIHFTCIYACVNNAQNNTHNIIWAENKKKHVHLWRIGK